MTKVWDKSCDDYVEMPAEMQAFLADLEVICRKHSLVVGLDKHDELVVQSLTEENLRFLLNSSKDYP